MAGGAHVGENLGQGLQEPAAAQIDAERNAPDFLLVALTEVDESRDQQRGKIVDAEKAVIFEGANGEASARPRQTGDNDDVQPVGHGESKLVILFGNNRVKFLARAPGHEAASKDFVFEQPRNPRQSL